MTRPTPAPNYPAESTNSLTLVFQVIKEVFYHHKKIELSAHVYNMALGVSAVQIGVCVDGQEIAASPALYESEKGIQIKTDRYGTINFPEDFDMVGEI
jgi:hypothetical protein